MFSELFEMDVQDCVDSFDWRRLKHAQAMRKAELFSSQELVDKYSIQYAISFHDFQLNGL